MLLPIKGTASLVIGISSDTMFMKTVRESITVTPRINVLKAKVDLHFIQILSEFYPTT